MPAGRPRGSKNKPDPTKELLQAAKEKPLLRRRARTEIMQGMKQATMPLDAVSSLCLKLHALRRGIPMTWLIQDILNLWLASATDYDQALFRDVLPRNARAARCPERFPGYIAGLGFAPQDEQAPIEIVESHDIPTAAPVPSAQAPMPHPSAYAAPTLTDLARPYQHPLTQGPASYAHPAPTPPPGSTLFDPESYRQVAPHSGTGNAAQRATAGEPMRDDLPPLPEQVQALLDFYRVRPEDVR